MQHGRVRIVNSDKVILLRKLSACEGAAMGSHRLLSPFTLLLICTVGSSVRAEYEQRDAREGDDIMLPCRFSLDRSTKESITYYWVRSTTSGHENVAIGDIPLETNYKISYAPENGRFDLMISNVSYERDNGRFECRVKAGGSGRTMHSQGVVLVVLTHPRAPLLTPGPRAEAQEGRELKLTCSSSGGSPEPDIKWYKDGSTYPLEAEMTHGQTRAEASTATLTLMPTRDDDGVTFRCVVWNRAMPEGQQLDATIDLSVNYFPRVEVGPENPLRVEIDGTATMECKVDAKPQVNSVRWTRNGKYISNSFTHTIHSVTVQEAGLYSCLADNGLGQPGEKEIYLDVLFPPSVSLESKTYEAEEGGTVEINCQVSANPKPTITEWILEGKEDFRQMGNILKLTKVNADMAGTYICRATNIISSVNGKRVERSSSASVAVLVRHKPGQAFISPDRPVAQEGTGVTLTCSAKPPGWPVPQYRWFRDIGISDSKPNVLATGNKYSIPSAHLGSEGVYHCQATNELGHGEIASVTLEVHQPPRFQAKLQPHRTKRAGEQDFSVSCSALGKPRPNVKWVKDNSELKADNNLYEIINELSEGRNSVYNVQSTLRFYGNGRPNNKDLLPKDRGIYTCMFENEVKKVESTMHLRIEHEPISINPQSKVAYDSPEMAEISCRIQAYPKPEFQWFYGVNMTAVPTSSNGHYQTVTTTDNNDSYLSVLKIKAVRDTDYGDYYCSVQNLLGTIQPRIRLQRTSVPDPPYGLTSLKVGPTYVTVKWEPGFDGGISSTKYFVNYKRVTSLPADGTSLKASNADCTEYTSDLDWSEYECGRLNPCNVTNLKQQNSYTFKVKAVNTRGHSNFSNEITLITKVDSITPPEQLTYDPATNIIAFSVDPTCLPLVGVAESFEGEKNFGRWQVVETIPLRLSGVRSTFHESIMELPSNPCRKSGGLITEQPMTGETSCKPKVQLKLCLQVNQEICSEYTEAELGPAYVKKDSDVLMTVLTIIIVCVVLLVVIWLLVLYCRSKRNDMTIVRTKDHELDSMKSAMESMKSQNQGPPPYSYPCEGMENKALEHSMDLPLPIDDSKNAMYSTQGGYGYRPSHPQAHPGQNMPASEWAYMENSYTNSNNGGSVNSQDSMWQMKMAAANGAPVIPPHQLLGGERQSNYEYDPMTHGGYGTVDDYAPYQRLPHAQPAPADYLRASQTPSRQDYCSDPYASVHKPKKRMDQHMESPYHEVSGLPEAYEGGGAGGDGCGEDKPAHLSLSYDESLESGYSTPNTRSRRVIREIIV